MFESQRVGERPYVSSSQPALFLAQINFWLRSFKPSHIKTPEQTRETFGGGKYHHCSWSLPCCQNTESWEGCGLWWNPTWNAQSLESRWNFLLILVCQVAWCSGRVAKDWQTRVIIPYTKRKTGMSASTTGAFLSLASLETYSPCQVPWKMMPRNKFTQFGFRPERSTTDLANFREILGVCQICLHMFLSTSRKHTTGFLVKSFG